MRIKKSYKERCLKNKWELKTSNILICSTSQSFNTLEWRLKKKTLKTKNRGTGGEKTIGDFGEKF